MIDVRIDVRIVIAGAALAAVAACHKNGEGPSTTTTTAGAVVSNQDAATRITNARCDREAACNNVGAGTKYADRDACTRELAPSARATLRAEVCPKGVSETQLVSCMDDIRNESCASPLDTIDHLTACRSGKLCIGD